jgi:TRAP-type transport system periplasmic protein
MPFAENFDRPDHDAAVWPRRSLLAAGAAVVAAPVMPRFARAAEFTWRIGHNAPPGFALHVRLQEAAREIAARSDGQMELHVYADSELGSPIGLLTQLRAGTIDAAPLTSQVLASNLAVAALPMLGFAFGGYDRAWAALDGDLGSLLRVRIKDRLGLVAMERCWNFGFRQITTSGKVIEAAESLEGLRLRTPPEADFIGLFQALKATPMTIPLNGLEKALQSHAIDGQESVLPLVKAAGLYRVQSTCALTNHVWDGHWMCISGKAWSSLPKKLKDIVAAAFDEGGLHQRQDTMGYEAATQQELEATGMKFTTVNHETFRQALQKAGYYAGWRKKNGDDGWTALEKYTPGSLL